MRHQKKTVKLGRTSAHRDAMLSNQVCSLIAHQRIKTTLAKAKATKPLAEKMVTLGKRGDLHARRTAFRYLQQKDSVKKLFAEIAPRAADRKGGYTRIIKLGPRNSDSAPMAYLEWVDSAPVEDDDTVVVPAAAKKEKPKAAKKTSAKAEGSTSAGASVLSTEDVKAPAKAEKPAEKPAKKAKDDATEASS